jgi:hypothetical protein
VINSEGESLQERMEATGVKTYQGTVVSSFPNFIWCLGPNTATNHSSVLFTTEAQIALAFHLIRPVLAKLAGSGGIKLLKPAPYVEVRREAEDRYYAELRERMKGMVWENKGGVAWYVDKATGLCTVRPFRSPLCFPSPARCVPDMHEHQRPCTLGPSSTFGAGALSRITATSSGQAAALHGSGGATSGGGDDRWSMYIYAVCTSEVYSLPDALRMAFSISRGDLRAASSALSSKETLLPKGV